MNSTLKSAYFGSKAADAIAMPVHWYYDTSALDRDYPNLSGYVKPHEKHPDSILWRSRYEPLNEEADILHDQAQFWGLRNVHYHQFLEAGENTLNLKLADALYALVIESGQYDAQAWLEHYVACMRTPGWHRDTYIEEYHRAFFTNRAKGLPLLNCGIDDRHIGGLATVPALVASLDEINGLDGEVVVNHVSLTHHNEDVKQGAEALTHMLVAIADGCDVRQAIKKHADPWGGASVFEALAKKPDRVIIGQMLTPACYMPESFAAALALAWKYHDDFERGILANARCGGDNCHRGVVIGALLAAANTIPEHLKELSHA